MDLEKISPPHAASWDQSDQRRTTGLFVSPSTVDAIAAIN